jgi:membrane associated rhomboid family serine protease
MFPIRDHNPSTGVPFVTIGLIVINVLIYLWGLGALETNRALAQFYFDYALLPVRLTNGENYTALITSVFLHGGLMHLAGNMLFLWIFGDNLEDEMGHLPFLLLYLASGIGASLAQVLGDPNSAIPVVGASGAIAGVMGGYLLLFPKARVDVLLILIVFIRVFPFPAWIMLGLWFTIQIFSGVSVDTSSGGVAYWAHAGGFVVGLILTIPLWLKKGAHGHHQDLERHEVACDEHEEDRQVGSELVDTKRKPRHAGQRDCPDHRGDRDHQRIEQIAGHVGVKEDLTVVGEGLETARQAPVVAVHEIGLGLDREVGNRDQRQEPDNQREGQQDLIGNLPRPRSLFDRGWKHQRAPFSSRYME